MSGPTGLRLRRLGVADLADYKRLRDVSLAAHPTAFTSDAEESRLRSAESYRGRLGLERPDGGDFLLGAWMDHRLVGAIGCEREPRQKAHHTAHVVGMMVLDDYRGQGIGRALLAECVALASRSKGLDMLTLSVTAGNTGAVRLYEDCGFTRYGSLPRAIRVAGAYYAKEQMVLFL